MSSVQDLLTFSGAAKTSGGGGDQGGSLGPLTKNLLLGFLFILFFNRVLIAPAGESWLQVVALLLPGLPPAALAIVVQDMHDYSRNTLSVMTYKLT